MHRPMPKQLLMEMMNLAMSLSSRLTMTRTAWRVSTLTLNSLTVEVIDSLVVDVLVPSLTLRMAMKKAAAEKALKMQVFLREAQLKQL